MSARQSPVAPFGAISVFRLVVAVEAAIETVAGAMRRARRAIAADRAERRLGVLPAGQRADLGV